MYSNKFFNFAIFLLFVHFLIACGSTPSNNSTGVKARPNNTLVNASIDRSTNYLEQAEKHWRIHRDIDKRNELLLTAAEQFQNNGQCLQTLVTISKIEPSLSNAFSIDKANILKSECAIALGSENKETVTSWLGKIVDGTFLKRQLVIRAFLNAADAQYESAIEKLIDVDKKDSYLLQQYPHIEWQWLHKVNEQGISRLATKSTKIASVVSLIALVKQKDLSDIDKQTAIGNWLTMHPEHEFNHLLPDNLEKFVNKPTKQIRNIVVALPLSGRLSSQGLAIKQGMLSAYYTNLSKTLIQNPGDKLPAMTFVDTTSSNQANIIDIINNASAEPIDLLIGPLLREHIAQVEQQEILFNHPILFLNRTSSPLNDMSDKRADIYFSLAPEDEAKQLANSMIEQGYQSPVIVHNDSNTSVRMLTTFLDEWNRLQNSRDKIDSMPNKSPPIVKFTDNKSMRIGITAALDVLQSQRRIRQIEGLTNETIYNVTRNRRDVDSFVVFADARETELLNPIIESSISLFSERTVPVFATSRSYQHQLNKNSIRDLRNLVFLDIPLLMPKQLESELFLHIVKLWNDPPSTFIRLFAFGYDSIALSQINAQLITIPDYSIRGLTGTLYTNAQHEVVRKLDMATIQSNGIVSIVTE